MERTMEGAKEDNDIDSNSIYIVIVIVIVGSYIIGDLSPKKAIKHRLA